jgi:hypothetical protein
LYHTRSHFKISTINEHYQSVLVVPNKIPPFRALFRTIGGVRNVVECRDHVRNIHFSAAIHGPITSRPASATTPRAQRGSQCQ